MRCALILLSVCAGWRSLASAAKPEVAQTEKFLREQARLHSQDFRASYLLAEFLIQQHKVVEAIPFLERARQIDPSHYANSYDLALAYLQTGMSEKSRRVIEGLLKQEDKPELHNLLGDVEEAGGNIQEAARQYEMAARMDPSEKHVFDLGSDLILHRGFEPALKVFEFGTRRYPKSARMRVGLGVIYYSLGQYDDAIESLCQAVDLDPADTKALDFLGKMHDISPQYADDVTKRLAHFVQTYPDNAAANYYYALSLRKRTLTPTSDTAEKSAQVFLQKTVELNPGFADAHYELGLLFEEEGQQPEAIHEYELATGLKPDLAKGHYHLARLYQKAGRTALAQQEFRSFERFKSTATAAESVAPKSLK